ncbi:MAG: TetR/AcrR family transcriptional regulator, partial [Mesorhizobium sp.]
MGTIDRRVARTRAMLQDALIALIPERGYAALTVEDICQKANIGRSTFYTHYAGKDELRTATLEAHLRSLTQKRLSSSSQPGKWLFEFSLPMFEHAQAFRSLHHALLSSSGDTIHDQLRDRIRRAVRSELAGNKPAGIPLEF